MHCAPGNASGEQKTLASVAAGLLNRHGKSPSVIMTLLPADALWIASLRADGPMQHCSWVDVTVIELWQLALDTGQCPAEHCRYTALTLHEVTPAVT